MKLNTIKKIYDELNMVNFGGCLERPVILLTRGYVEGKTQDLGRGRVAMRFNPKYNNGIEAMRSTVYHEMIHQYLDFYLKEEDNDDHGDKFWFIYHSFVTPDILIETPYTGEYYYD